MQGPNYNSTWRGTAAALAVAVLLVAALTGVLYARAPEAASQDGRAPLPVASTDYTLTDGYTREQRFLGLVRAATGSAVGFEVAGTVAAIEVREGDRVAAGQVLATLDQRTLEARARAAAARVSQLRSELELASGRTARQAPLRDSGAISAQAFDDTRLAEQAVTAGLSAAEAELQALEIALEKSVLRAPYDAVVGRQLLDTGSVTSPGTPLFEVIATADREAHVGVAVEQAGAAVPGAEYALTVRGRSVDARLRSIRPDVDASTMTAVAIFDLPPEVAAFDGEPVTLSLPQAVALRGGWLPVAALLEGARGVWTVLRIEPGDGGLRAVREAVEVLHVSGDRAYVRGTLNSGDRVVADGIHRIAPGTRVRLAGV